MDNNGDSIQDLIDYPQESLAVELKSWIDFETPEGKAKIIKAVIALRNNNGGFLIIGIDEETRQVSDRILDSAEDIFNKDAVQGLITNHSSESFEIDIRFPKKEDKTIVVIQVPNGVTAPVATKRSLHAGNKDLVKNHAVYVRSLKANNTPSTTEAKYSDWPRITELCFENREADIGRFLRRHLVTAEARQAFISALQEAAPDIENQVRELLQLGRERFETVTDEGDFTLPDHGAWEVAASIVGDVAEHNEFLNLLASRNPSYTGWPVWLDSRGFQKEESQPYVFQGAWEALIFDQGRKWGGKHLDFWRLDPKGRFYLYRALQDDLSRSEQAPDPLTQIDFALAILRTAEALAVGLEFAKVMCLSPDDASVMFSFRWSRLKGRTLTAWANPSRSLGSYLVNRAQDEVTSELRIPVETPKSALYEYVHQATRPLFEVFSGFALDTSVVEDLTNRLLERRL